MARLGIVNEETWDFFAGVFEDLSAHHRVTVFRRPTWNLPAFHVRMNRYLTERGLRAFMRASDVVFFEWASDLLAVATRLPERCGIIARLHRYELYEWAGRIDWDRVDRLIVVSEAKRREFLERFPEHAGKVTVVHPGVSLTRFAAEARSFRGRIGTLCHLTPRKRVYDLILAFAEVVAEGADLHLHVAGGPHPSFADYEHALRRIVDRLGLQSRVTFHGHVKDTPAWYREIDVFVSNSYSEGLQVALLEAMASGCHCLVHHWDGAEEILPEENLFLGGRELGRKLLDHVALPEAEKVRRAGRMRSIVEERFDFEATKAMIRAAIEQVAFRNSSGSRTR